MFTAVTAKHCECVFAEILQAQERPCGWLLALKKVAIQDVPRGVPVFGSEDVPELSEVPLPEKVQSRELKLHPSFPF